jgi:hypothetical protein
MDTWEVDFSMPTVRNVVTVGSHAAPAVAGPDITPVTWTHSPIPRATLIQLFCKPPERATCQLFGSVDHVRFGDQIPWHTSHFTTPSSCGWIKTW